jgi:hypothetical protein
VTTPREHLATWRANEATSQRLIEMREYGWAITCLFYAALHLVEAKLSDQEGKTSTHVGRAAVMRNEVDLQPILRYYAALKRESENHRYRCRLYSVGEVNRVRSLLYAPLSTHLRNLLGVN